MAEKMTRRTFMKSAAAAAAAISLSGVLTGCGGSGQLADDEVQIGPFTVKVFGLDVDLGTESGTDKGAITGKVRLRYAPAAAAGRADSTATCSKLPWAKQS